MVARHTPAVKEKTTWEEYNNGVHQIDKHDPPSFKKEPPQAGGVVKDVFQKTKWEDKQHSDFHWLKGEEPHKLRRKAIMKDHPEIRQLFGHEPLTAVIVLGITAAQLWICTWIGATSWPVYMLVMYAFGGTVNHTLQLANHEISHNLCFGPQWPKANIIMGIIANFATGVPSSVPFKYYHYEHHLYQGIDGVDTDIPSVWELWFFKGPLRKILWVFLQPGFYALRPLFIKPRPVTGWQVVNTVVQFAFDYWVYKTFGLAAICYLFFGTLLGMGLHPCAGHFIAEHYEFMKGYETYSYYGSCNFFNLMVGYHNEHHDFPKVAWSNLAKVKAMAPEYYDHLPCHTSYIRVFWNFITDPEIGMWSRVKRQGKEKKGDSLD